MKLITIKVNEVKRKIKHLCSGRNFKIAWIKRYFLMSIIGIKRLIKELRKEGYAVFNIDNTLLINNCN